MKPNIYRNVLSKALLTPSNYGPSHGVRLTNREVWAFSELSMAIVVPAYQWYRRFF